MYSTKMSLKSFIVVASVILYSINQASALHCYACASRSEGECYKNPKQEHHKMDCSVANQIPQFDSQFYNVASDIQRVLSNYTGNNMINNMLQADCMTIIGEIANEKAVVRTCSPKLMTCDMWKSKVQYTSNMRVVSCDKCDSDLCNSAQHLSVGFLSLIGSLLIFAFARM